jgi:hypothetical protein
MNKTNKKVTFDSRENTLNPPELILVSLILETSTERIAQVGKASEVEKETEN